MEYSNWFSKIFRQVNSFILKGAVRQRIRLLQSKVIWQTAVNITKRLEYCLRLLIVQLLNFILIHVRVNLYHSILLNGKEIFTFRIHTTVHDIPKTSCFQANHSQMLWERCIDAIRSNEISQVIKPGFCFLSDHGAYWFNPEACCDAESLFENRNESKVRPSMNDNGTESFCFFLNSWCFSKIGNSWGLFDDAPEK